MGVFGIGGKKGGVTVLATPQTTDQLAELIFLNKQPEDYTVIPTTELWDGAYVNGSLNVGGLGGTVTLTAEVTYRSKKTVLPGKKKFDEYSVREINPEDPYSGLDVDTIPDVSTTIKGDLGQIMLSMTNYDANRRAQAAKMVNDYRNLLAQMIGIVAKETKQTPSGTLELQVGQYSR